MPYSQKSSQVDVFKQSTSLSVASIPLFYQQTVEKTVSKHTHNSCFQQTTFERNKKTIIDFICAEQTVNGEYTQQKCLFCDEKNI